VSSRHAWPLLFLLLALPVRAGEPTVVVSDPARVDPDEEALLLTGETLALRAHADLLARVPVPDNPAIGGPAMIGISTVSAARVKRGDVPEDVARRLDGWDGWGAAVLRVLPGSPAEAAWLQPGDVVVRYSGLWVDRDETLTWFASRSDPFREVEVWYWREGQVHRTWLKPGVRDVVQAEGDGRNQPIEGVVLEFGRNGLVPPRLLEEVEVEYPSTARRMGVGGTGTYRVIVGVDGAVSDASVREGSGSEALDEAALEAMRERRYEPGRYRGRPIAVAVDVEVGFWPEGPPDPEQAAVEEEAERPEGGGGRG
jgi:TonB family protein